MIETKPRHRRRFFYHHSLTIVSAGLLTLWIVLYSGADPATHLGSFFGNSIADWSGSLVIIVGTKYLLEFQSAESRRVTGHLKNSVLDFLWRHSLLIFLGVTGIGWAVLFWKMDANSKWGQVAGNIVSEWVQMTGLVFLTKRLIEKARKKAIDSSPTSIPCAVVNPQSSHGSSIFATVFSKADLIHAHVVLAHCPPCLDTSFSYYLSDPHPLLLGPKGLTSL